MTTTSSNIFKRFLCLLGKLDDRARSKTDANRQTLLGAFGWHLGHEMLHPLPTTKGLRCLRAPGATSVQCLIEPSKNTNNTTQRRVSVICKSSGAVDEDSSFGERRQILPANQQQSEEILRYFPILSYIISYFSFVFSNKRAMTKISFDRLHWEVESFASQCWRGAPCASGAWNSTCKLTEKHMRRFISLTKQAKWLPVPKHKLIPDRPCAVAHMLCSTMPVHFNRLYSRHLQYECLPLPSNQPYIYNLS